MAGRVVIIHKWKLDQRTGFPAQTVPARHLFSIGVQGDDIVVWGVPSEGHGVTHVALLRTGQDHPAIAASFLGTVQTPDGLVWHAFVGPV
jgi:hypothetical protein